MPNASIGVSAGPLRISQGLGCGGLLALPPGLVGLLIILAIVAHFSAPAMTTFEGSGTYVASNHVAKKIKPGTWQGNTRVCEATVNGRTTFATFTVKSGETVHTEYACTWEWVAA
jgi:hypothetical protein